VVLSERPDELLPDHRRVDRSEVVADGVHQPREEVRREVGSEGGSGHAQRDAEAQLIRGRSHDSGRQRSGAPDPHHDRHQLDDPMADRVHVLAQPTSRRIPGGIHGTDGTNPGPDPDQSVRTLDRADVMAGTGVADGTGATHRPTSSPPDQATR